MVVVVGVYCHVCYGLSTKLSLLQGATRKQELIFNDTSGGRIPIFPVGDSTL